MELLLYFSACVLTNNRSISTEEVLINQMGEKIHFWILDDDTASRIGNLPFIEPEELSLPELLENESVKIDLIEIEVFLIEKMDQEFLIVLYMIHESSLDYPGPFAVCRHYGNISYEYLNRNQGKKFLRFDKN